MCFVVIYKNIKSFHVLFQHKRKETIIKIFLPYCLEFMAPGLCHLLD